MIEHVWIQRVYPPGDVFEFYEDDVELVHRDAVTEDRLEDVLRCLDAEERGVRMPSGLKSVRVADAPDVASPPPSGTPPRRAAPDPHVGPDVGTSTGYVRGGAAVEPPPWLKASPEEVARRNAPQDGKRW